jgi:hypothetical protein
MPDIVLNTNAFGVLLDSAILDKVVTRQDHVYVARCAWEKELKGVYSLAIQTLYTAERKLENRFHNINVNSDILPLSLKKEMRRKGASECDIEIAGLAYDRRRKSGQIVHLITNDPHFLLLKLAFERLEINVKERDEFITSY